MSCMSVARLGRIFCVCALVTRVARPPAPSVAVFECLKARGGVCTSMDRLVALSSRYGRDHCARGSRPRIATWAHTRYIPAHFRMLMSISSRYTRVVRPHHLASCVKASPCISVECPHPVRSPQFELARPLSLALCFDMCTCGVCALACAHVHARVHEE